MSPWNHWSWKHALFLNENLLFFDISACLGWLNLKAAQNLNWSSHLPDRNVCCFRPLRVMLSQFFCFGQYLFRRVPILKTVTEWPCSLYLLHCFPWKLSSFHVENSQFGPFRLPPESVHRPKNNIPSWLQPSGKARISCHNCCHRTLPTVGDPQAQLSLLFSRHLCIQAWRKGLKKCLQRLMPRCWSGENTAWQLFLSDVLSLSLWECVILIYAVVDVRIYYYCS